MSHPSVQDAGFEQLVELAKQAASSSVDPVIDRMGRARLVERVLRSSSSKRFWVGWFGPVPKMAWVTVVVFVVGGFVWGLASRPIGFVVREAAESEAYVRAADDHPVDIDFSDGSRIHADTGARLRIEERSSRGARILLERGRAMVHVAHRAGANWCFVAGPFEVEVKGTRFLLEWDPVAEQLDLRLEEGLVEVVGPLSPRQVAVHAGQQLRANLSKRSLMLSESDAGTLTPNHSLMLPESDAGTLTSNHPAVDAEAGAAAKSPIVSGSASAEPGANGAADSGAVREVFPQSSGVASAQPPPAQAQLSWSKMLAKGQFEGIVRLAESPERPNCAENCSATDLRSLAEAARYVGRTDLAENTLLALRRRFPEHLEAKKAAFLLGRLYEARADRGRAETWYQTYLRESPSSELAADALAGQMRVVRRARGVKAAEPLAREYLRRYPDGVHAAAAQQILREP